MRLITCLMVIVPLWLHAGAGKDILDLVDKKKSENHLNSVLFGVWVNGRELVRGAVGESMSNVPATDRMRVRAGAVTITFLVNLLLEFVESGELALNDPISKWYPKLPNADLVTLKMLANCTSGYPDYVQADAFVEANYNDPFRNWLAEELLDIAFEKPPLFVPGKEWKYSHTNYVLLGEILQKVAGHPLDQLFQFYFFGPLCLRETFYPLTPEIPEPVLHAYTNERKIYEDSTFWNPSWTSHSGRIVSTIEDLGRWIQDFGSGITSSKELFGLISEPVTIGMGNNTPERYYGLGVGVINSWICQTPRFGGFNGFIGYLPSKRIAIVVVTTLTDKASPDINFSYEIAQKISEILVPERSLLNDPS